MILVFPAIVVLRLYERLPEAFKFKTPPLILRVLLPAPRVFWLPAVTVIVPVFNVTPLVKVFAPEMISSDEELS